MTNSLWIHYWFREFTLNSLSYSRNQYKITIFFAISLWIYSIFRIQYLFCEFTLNPRSFSNHYDFDMKSLWNHYAFTIFFTFSLRIHHLFRECTICFANSLWFHYLLRDFSLNSLFFPEFTFNSLSASRFQYEFTISFANSPWIHFLREITNLWIHYVFAKSK